MTSTPTYSLEALERRWQLEKTPQVGLRLAEQYRRKGDLLASIEALSAGIEIYPTHTASRVALSRDLVDSDRFDEAVSHLEQIVERDPAHLVANKLLVRAYVGVGKINAARDKLAIYEMMGEGDADIERLHGLLAAAEGGEAASAPAEGDEPFGPALVSGDSSKYWQEIADEGIFVFETPAPEASELAAVEDPAAVGESTVTLGELYLEQGHREEAVEVFKEVLTREPRNEAAQRGLEITKELPTEVASLGGDVKASEGGSTQDSVERKKLALTAYLGRIRQAVAAGI